MKFYLDEDLSAEVAAALRRRGIDALSAHEAGQERRPDREQLDLAAREGRCLVTRNVRHFRELANAAVRGARPHAGIVLCPRSVRGNEIGVIADRLAGIAQRYPRGLGHYDVVFL